MAGYPAQTFFDVDEAIQKGTIIMNLLSDSAQSITWPRIKPMLTKGKVRNAMFRSSRFALGLIMLLQTLYFSHGFSPVFKDQTKVDVPDDIDVHPRRPQRVRPHRPHPLPRRPRHQQAVSPSSRT